MGAHLRLVISSFIFKLILIHHNRIIEASPNIEDLDLHSRFSKIEAKDHHQDREIFLLQNALVEEKELVQDLTNRLAFLEDSNKVFGRWKRPFRLLPPHIPRGPEKDKADADDENNRLFYGPATGCNDLGKLGYTLNGYYLVHGKETQPSNSSGTQIEVVECRFRQKPKTGNQNADDKESRLGFIRINNDNNINIPISLNEKEECLYRFKNNRQVSCLVAEQRKNQKSGSLNTTNNPGFHLIQLPCDSINTEEQLWKRKDKHICSNKNDNCLTVSPNTKGGGVFLNLTAYEASAKSQQWRINMNAVNGALTIINIGTSLCLFDSAIDYDKIKKVKASTTVRQCDNGLSLYMENQFYLELANFRNGKKCALL